MQKKTAFFAALLGSISMAAAAFAGDADTPELGSDTLSGVPLFQRTFGGAGLLTKWSSNETYGITQARINLELSQHSMASATGVSTGYSDSISQLVTPVSLLYGLPDGRSFIALSGSTTSERGQKNLTYGDVELGSTTLEYINMPTDNLAWGIGATFEIVDTNLNANNATVNSYLGGLRVDLLYKPDDHFGVASRVVGLAGHADTMVPLSFADVTTSQDFKRFYWQTDFVATISHDDFAFIGEGWLIHPTLSTVLQRTNRQDTTNSLGSPVAGDSISYSMAGASVRVEKPVFRPGAWSPQFELGVEHEFTNTYGHYTGEENYLATKIGFGRRIGKSAYLNIAYSREDGFTGARRQQAATVIYSLSF